MSVDVQKNLEEKISKSIEVLKEKLNSVRAGRATLHCWIRFRLNATAAQCLSKT